MQVSSTLHLSLHGQLHLHIGLAKQVAQYNYPIPAFSSGAFSEIPNRPFPAKGFAIDEDS
jgi:hypothetical protein